MKSSPQSKMHLIRTLAIWVCVVCVLLGAGRIWPRQTKSLAAQFKLPADFANYKDWKKQVDAPTPVPFALWAQCTMPAPTDLEDARRKYGPHNDHYIQVYANPVAAQHLLPGNKGPFPTGSVIAKEKLFDSAAGTVFGVAFMTKRSEPKFASSGGWEFSYYPQSSEPASADGCVNCHVAAASTDYIFGQYPSRADGMHPIPTYWH
jgi:hypothetical protein